MDEGNGERPDLLSTMRAFRQAMDEYAGALARSESDPDVETARRAMVRRWAELATEDGSELPWVLEVLLRAMDRMDREDAARERSTRRGRRTGRKGPE
ncbi:MAG TPA: hypothetical protein VM759_04800 [Longimicrobium sp.]|nr:hypothetical protein [Longimicrobium sp.]